MAAQISSTQNATTVVGASRDDLVTGAPVTLDSLNTHTTYSWTLAYAPEGSTATFSGSDVAKSPGTFTPDLEGAYLIRLIADLGLVTESTQFVRLRILSAIAGLKYIAAGETYTGAVRIPVDAPLTGWANDFNANLALLETLIPGGTGAAWDGTYLVDPSVAEDDDDLHVYSTVGAAMAAADAELSGGLPIVVSFVPTMVVWDGSGIPANRFVALIIRAAFLVWDSGANLDVPSSSQVIFLGPGNLDGDFTLQGTVSFNHCFLSDATWTLDSSLQEVQVNVEANSTIRDLLLVADSGGGTTQRVEVVLQGAHITMDAGNVLFTEVTSATVGHHTLDIKDCIVSLGDAPIIVGEGVGSRSSIVECNMSGGRLEVVPTGSYVLAEDVTLSLQQTRIFVGGTATSVAMVTASPGGSLSAQDVMLDYRGPIGSCLLDTTATSLDGITARPSMPPSNFMFNPRFMDWLRDGWISMWSGSTTVGSPTGSLALFLSGDTSMVMPADSPTHPMVRIQGTVSCSSPGSATEGAVFNIDTVTKNVSGTVAILSGANGTKTWENPGASGYAVTVGATGGTIHITVDQSGASGDCRWVANLKMEVIV